MILSEIVKKKNTEINNLKKKRYSFQKILGGSNLTVIGEIKKSSPSKGIISEKFNPELKSKQYKQGGVDAISILTDQEFFQGSNNILKDLRLKTELPILRKEFILEPIQIYESKFLGADIILLIAAILTEKKLNELLAITEEIGLEAIVEVHNIDELEMVFNSSANIIGINNRNLKDFSVDLDTTRKIVRYLNQNNVKDEYYLISESGIKNRDDIEFIESLEVDGVLIGETLMKAEDPVQKIYELKGLR